MTPSSRWAVLLTWNIPYSDPGREIPHVFCPLQYRIHAASALPEQKTPRKLK